MTRILVCCAFVLFAMTFVSTAAEAWYCRAESPSAYGWGRNYSLAQAKRRALWECARRTPRYQTCYIVYCR